jgi:hypothetical protein
MRDETRTNRWVNVLALCFLTTWPITAPQYMDRWHPDGGPRMMVAMGIFWTVGTVCSGYLLRTGRFRVWTWFLLSLYALGELWVIIAFTAAILLR